MKESIEKLKDIVPFSYNPSFAAFPSFSQRSDVENAPDCTICLETLKQGDEVKKLPCGHVFHSVCVTPWLMKKRAVCPVCRQGIFDDDMLVESAGWRMKRRIG